MKRIHTLSPVLALILTLKLGLISGCKKDETTTKIVNRYESLKENWSIESTPRYIYPTKNGFIGVRSLKQISCYSKTDGSILWTYPDIVSPRHLGKRLGFVHNDVFYAVLSYRSIVAIDVNSGAKLWSIDIDSSIAENFSRVLRLNLDGKLLFATESTSSPMFTKILTADLNGQNIDTVHKITFLNNGFASIFDITGRNHYLRVLYEERSASSVNHPISVRLITNAGFQDTRALDFDGSDVPTEKVKFLHQKEGYHVAQINNRVVLFWEHNGIRRIGFETLYNASSDGKKVYVFHRGNSFLPPGIHDFDIDNLTTFSKISTVESQSLGFNPFFVSHSDEKIFYHTTVPQTKALFPSRYGIMVFDLKTQEQKVFDLGYDTQAALAVDTVNKVFYTRNVEKLYQVSY